MDLQADVVAMFGPAATAVIDRTASVIEAARRSGATVIYVVLGFRPGYPEVSPNNAIFSMLSGSGRFQGPPGADIPPAIAPKPGDVIVVKHRVSAFHGTDLDMILRAKGIDTLLLTGIATSGIVLSTVCHAADADYKSVIVGDCCGDREDEIHRLLLDKVLVRRATVMTAAEAVAALS